MPKNKANEKRKHPRLAVKVPVKFRMEDPTNVLRGIEEWRGLTLHGFTLNMGKGGMQIVVDQPLTLGDVLKFDLFLFFIRDYVSAFAKVAWVNERGAGLQFLTMTDPDRKAFEDYLRSLETARFRLAKSNVCYL